MLPPAGVASSVENRDPPATFSAGTYRLIVDVYVPSGPMLFGCEQLIEVVAGEDLTVIFSEIPEYRGSSFFWWAPGEIVMTHTTCPGGTPVP